MLCEGTGSFVTLPLHWYMKRSSSGWSVLVIGMEAASCVQPQATQHRASRQNSSSRGSHSFAVRGDSSGARRHKTHRRASTPVDLGRSSTPDRRRSSGGPSESGAGRQKTHGRTSTPVDHARSTTPEHLSDNGDVSSESAFLYELSFVSHQTLKLRCVVV